MESKCSFGARANLAKTLLYAINGGVDEKLFIKVAPGFEPITDEVLDFDKVMEKYDLMMEWLAHTYVKALNAIHYMHDKYYYERIEMALHDRDILRTMACGIAGLSVAADSLSAIKYAKVYPIRNEMGVAIDFKIEGTFPAYGNIILSRFYWYYARVCLWKSSKTKASEIVSDSILLTIT